MSDIMSDMGSSVTVRQLQKELKRVLARVERGQTLLVTRRRRPVAILAPPRAAVAEPWPDLDKRARSVLGERVISPPPSELIGSERGER
jgi:prevent-host-death family protein